MYGRPLTEEERLAQAIAGMRNPYTDPRITMESQVAKELRNLDPSKIPGHPQAPGMPQTGGDPFFVKKERDFSPEAATIKNQRAYANALRGQEMAQGREVGPLDVYVGPNWGEQAAYVGRQALGGHLSGEADRASTGLSKAMEQDAAEVSQSEADAARYAEGTRRRERAEDVDIQAGRWAAEDAMDLSERRYEAGQDAQNRKYIGVVDPKNPFNRDVIRQGDDVPEGMMLMSDFTDKVQAENTGGVGKPAAKAVADYTKSLDLSYSVKGLNDIYANLNDAQKEMLNSPKMDTLLGIVDKTFPEGTQRMLEEAYYDQPEVLEYRIKANKLEGDISKLMAGLTVTGFEMKDRKKWSPMAEGITQEQRQARLDEINDKLNNTQQMFEMLYPAYNLREGGSSESGGSNAGPVKITTQAEFDALPSGAKYIDPDDEKVYRKP